MIRWHEELNFDFEEMITARLFTEKVLFFDIETTGFSSVRSFVYLIGCAYRKKEQLLLEQFFAETPSEEIEVLHAFCGFLEAFDTVITFNGIGFDIPYLRAKCERFQIADPFARLQFLDLFKEVSRIRFLLKLPNFKQKSVEAFLGIEREDPFNGGELIDVYRKYAVSPTKEALHLLRQHNFEDVLDMPKLLPILAYTKLLDGNFSVVSLEGHEYTDYDGGRRKELLMTLRCTFPLPKRVSCGWEDFYLTANGDSAHLRIRLFEGELKFFFDDYRNYYYLPKEDSAVHKSISSYVDKNHRKNATASTCYTRKYAIFLPQYENLIEPLFHENHKDRKSYFELTPDFAESKSIQRRYAEHILKLFSTKKKQHV